MTLIERTPNLMQRLSRLPTTPQLALLHRRKPKPFTWPHATPPLERNLYEMVLHRPIETTRLTGQVRFALYFFSTGVSGFVKRIARSAPSKAAERTVRTEWARRFMNTSPVSPPITLPSRVRPLGPSETLMLTDATTDAKIRPATAPKAALGTAI